MTFQHNVFVKIMKFVRDYIVECLLSVFKYGITEMMLNQDNILIPTQEPGSSVG